MIIAVGVILRGAATALAERTPAAAATPGNTPPPSFLSDSIIQLMLIISSSTPPPLHTPSPFSPSSSCECDLVVEDRPSGGKSCDTSCDSCEFDQCKCCAGLTQRTHTLCCRPLPLDASWDVAVAVSNVYGGDCHWSCNSGFTEREGTTNVVLFDWDNNVCCQKPSHSHWDDSTDCEWICDPGFTRESDIQEYHPTSPSFWCNACKSCPTGFYVTEACTPYKQTTCTPCRTCSAADGLFPYGGCTGWQDRICAGKITHDPYTGLGAEVSSIIQFRLSHFFGGPLSADTVTIRPYSPTGQVSFSPQVLTLTAPTTTLPSLDPSAPSHFLATVSVTPAAKGIHTVKYEIGGFQSCPCALTPVGEICKPGCADGTAFLPMPDDIITVFQPDHTSVFERMGVAIGALPPGPFKLPALTCPDGSTKYSFISSNEWKDLAGPRPYTCGVVQADLSFATIPLSVTGAKVTKGNYFSNIEALLPATHRASCAYVPTFEEDVIDYSQANAMARAIFANLGVPKWLDLSTVDAPVVSINTDDLYITAVRGKDVNKHPGCVGVPVTNDADYFLFRYRRALRVRLDGAEVVLPASVSDDMCFLLDMCSSGGCSGYGGIAFRMQLPASVFGALSALPAFAELKAAGISIQAFTFGFGGAMEAFPSGSKPNFWNGDQQFVPKGTNYNFYLGGKADIDLGGVAKLDVTGTVAFELPGLCGDYRDLISSGGWGFAGRVAARVMVPVFGTYFEMASGSLSLMMNVGGPESRDYCKPWDGTRANPPGLFVSLYAQVNPFAGTVLGFFYPKVKADIQAYLAVSQHASIIPQFVRDNFRNQIGNAKTFLVQLKSEFEDIVALAKSDGKAAMARASDMVTDMKAARGECLADPMCWMSSSNLASAKNNMDLAEGKITGALGHQSKLLAVADEVADLLTTAAAQLTSNVDLAVGAATTTFTDRYDGFGVRVDVQFCLMAGFCYGAGFGLTAEVTFSRAEAYRRCSEFQFLYEEIFEDMYKGKAATRASARTIVSSTSHPDAPSLNLFDHDGSTFWEPSINMAKWHTPLYPTGAGVVFNIWNIDTVNGLWIQTNCSDGHGACPHRIMLSVLNSNVWIDVATASLPRSDGPKTHRVPLASSQTSFDYQQWRFIVLSQYVYDKESDTWLENKPIPFTLPSTTANPSPTPITPRVYDLELYGYGPHYAMAVYMRANWPMTLDPFNLITMNKGYHMEVALGLAPKVTATSFDRVDLETMSGDYLIRVGVDNDILGIRVTTAAFITAHVDMKDGEVTGVRGVTFSLAAYGNIWGLIQAHISATTFLKSNRIGWLVKGNFDNNFQTVLAERVHKAINDLSSEADKRLTGAQDEVRRWQGGIDKAVGKLDDAKKWLDSKKKDFDKAIGKLEDAKKKLEDAKAPLRRAEAALVKAEEKVKNLCRIRHCRDVCIPGFVMREKCGCLDLGFRKICGCLHVPVPTSCMVRVPDPVCVVANAACQLLHTAARAALKLAQAALRIPMAALELAQGVLTVAQGVVNAAKSVLDLAKGALTLAQETLKGLRKLLDGAIAALELVKVTLKFGLQLLNTLVTFAIKDLFNVRHIDFEVEVSTRNPIAISISMDLTILGIELNNIGFSFDFGDIVGAMADLLKFLLDRIKRGLGIRRRRDLVAKIAQAEVSDDWSEVQRIFFEHVQSSTDNIEERLRKDLEKAGTNSTTAGAGNGTANATTSVPPIDIAPLSNETDCECYFILRDYLQAGVAFLQDIHRRQAEIELNNQRVLNLRDELRNNSQAFAEKDDETYGINMNALADFNITREEAMGNLTSDRLLSDPVVQTTLNDIDGFTSQYMADVESGALSEEGWSELWQLQVENMTMDCGHVVCKSFADCTTGALQWMRSKIEAQNETVCSNLAVNSTTSSAGEEGLDGSVGSSGNLTAEASFALKTGCVTQVNLSPKLESMLRRIDAAREFFELALAENMTLTEASNRSEAVAALLKEEREEALICGQAPSFTVPVANTSVFEGSNTTIACGATGRPQPRFSWLKDGQALPAFAGQPFITLPAVRFSDAGRYSCVATNSKGVATSNEGILRVYSEDMQLRVQLELKTPLPNDTAARTTLLESAAIRLMGVGKERIYDREFGTGDESNSFAFTVGPPIVADGSASLRDIFLAFHTGLCQAQFWAGGGLSTPDELLHVFARDAPGTYATFTTSARVPEAQGAGAFLGNRQLLMTVDDPAALDDADFFTQYPPVFSLADPALADTFAVSPTNGSVYLLRPLNREDRDSYAVPVTVVYPAGVAESGDAPCPRLVADFASFGKVAVRKNCTGPGAGAGAPPEFEQEISVLLQLVKQGNVDCLGVLTPLIAGLQACGEQASMDLLYGLQGACMAMCDSVPGANCGLPNNSTDVCPRVHELTAIVAVVKQEVAAEDLLRRGVRDIDTDRQVQCHVAELSELGVCFVEEQRVCNAQDMAASLDAARVAVDTAEAGGAHSCDAYSWFLRNNVACEGKQRQDDDLLSKVRVNCMAHCNRPDCVSCNNTLPEPAAAAMAALEARIGLGEAEALTACVLLGALIDRECQQDMLADDSHLFAPARQLFERACNSTADAGDTGPVVPNKEDLARTAIGIVQLQLDCVSVVAPFIAGLEQCGPGLVNVSLMGMLQRDCLARCRPSGVWCGPTVVHHLEVQVVVEDVNDHSPVFDAEEYTAVVAESIEGDLGLGEFVAQVVATDGDIGDNALVSYTIARAHLHACGIPGGCLAPWNSSSDTWWWVMGEEAPFAVDVLTGRVTVAEELDHEVFDKAWLEITAQDGGGAMARNTTVWLKVEIDDRNDRAPVLSLESVAKIGENVPIGTAVETMDNTTTVASAFDADKVDVGALRFAILSGDNGVFDINPVTGVITTTSLVNYEDASSYRLEIEVMDAVGHKDSGFVTVMVEDKDEFRFIEPLPQDAFFAVTLDEVYNAAGEGSWTFHVGIPEHTEDIPSFVFQLLASDDVRGSTAENVSYTLIQTNGPVPFKLDDDGTGWLVVLAEFDRETRDNYRFAVEAVDLNAGSEAEVLRAVVEVSVLDINDHSPRWATAQLGGVQAMAYGCQAAGQSVATLRAYDDDIGVNALLWYSMTNGSFKAVNTSSGEEIAGAAQILEVDGLSGQVRLVVDGKDLVDGIHYEFQAEVQDSGDVPRTADTEVSVVVEVDAGGCMSAAKSSDEWRGAGVGIGVAMAVLVAVAVAVVVLAKRRAREQGKVSSIDDGEQGARGEGIPGVGPKEAAALVENPLYDGGTEFGFGELYEALHRGGEEYPEYFDVRPGKEAWEEGEEGAGDDDGGYMEVGEEHQTDADFRQLPKPLRHTGLLD